MINIGINGFGRIGRMVCRSILENYDNVNIVAINDPFLKIDDMVYLFKYDSTHGRFKGNIIIEDNKIVIGKHKIMIFAYKNPSDIKWYLAKAEYICESTGVFLTRNKAKGHLQNGPMKVIITGLSYDVDMFVMGVNNNRYINQDIVSNASCTTNCLAPLVKIINDEYGIIEGLVTTIHAATTSQKTVDSGGINKRRSFRSALCNIIPGPTKAAKAISKIIPEMKNKISGMAFRIPIPDVSVIDFTFRTKKCVNYMDIVQLIKDKSESKEMNGILGYTEDDVVSMDFLNDTRSCIVDLKAGIQLNNNFIKLVAWYDNEYAYSNRVVDLILYMDKCKKN